MPLLSVASTVENFTIVHITLARITAINERFTEAFQLLDYVHSVLESGCHQRFLAQVCREKMRLHPYDEEWERFGFAYTLLLLHRKRTDEARAILTVLRDSARTAGFVYREVALEAALSECEWQAGDQEAAFQAVNRGFAFNCSTDPDTF